MQVILTILFLFFSPLTMAQEFISLWSAPTRGGTEGGIPGLIRPLASEFNSYGYFVATFDGRSFDPRRATHVIVVGPGGDSGLLFQLSAVARAKKYREPGGKGDRRELPHAPGRTLLKLLSSDVVSGHGHG